MSLTKSSLFSIEKAHDFATICAWTYNKQATDLKLDNFQVEHIIEHPSTDTQCFVGILDGNLPVIAFRGTELKLRDWLIDLRFWQRGIPYAGMMDSDIRLHTGFITAYHSVRLEIYRAMAKYQDLQAPVVIGHSLGGGVANICAVDQAYLFDRQGEVVCITYGQPRVGNAAFVASADRYIYHIRYVNGNDPIPAFPRIGYAPGGIQRPLGVERQGPFSLKDHQSMSYIIELRRVMYGLP